MAHPLSEGVPEKNVARILARAAEFDRSAVETVTPAAIRAAAIDAGISSAAVDQALEEYAAGRMPDIPASSSELEEESRRSRWLRRLRKLGRPILYGAIAMVVGALIGATGDGGWPLIFLGWIGWVAFSGRQVLQRARTDGGVIGFIITTAAATLGVMSGFGSAGGDEDVLMFLLSTGVLLLTAGSLIIKFWKREPALEPAVELSSNGS